MTRPVGWKPRCRGTILVVGILLQMVLVIAGSTIVRLVTGNSIASLVFVAVVAPAGFCMLMQLDSCLQRRCRACCRSEREDQENPNEVFSTAASGRGISASFPPPPIWTSLYCEPPPSYEDAINRDAASCEQEGSNNNTVSQTNTMSQTLFQTAIVHSSSDVHNASPAEPLAETCRRDNDSISILPRSDPLNLPSSSFELQERTERNNNCSQMPENSENTRNLESATDAESSTSRGNIEGRLHTKERKLGKENAGFDMQEATEADMTRSTK